MPRFSDRHIGMPLIEIGYSDRSMVYVVNKDAIRLMTKQNIKKMYSMLDEVREVCVDLKTKKKKQPKQSPPKKAKLNKRLELLSCLSEYKFKQALIIFKINLIYRHIKSLDKIGIGISVVNQFAKYAKQYGYTIPTDSDGVWYEIIEPLQDYIEEISSIYNVKWSNCNYYFKTDYFKFMYNFCGRDSYLTATTIECSMPALMKYVTNKKQKRKIG